MARGTIDTEVQIRTWTWRIARSLGVVVMRYRGELLDTRWMAWVVTPWRVWTWGS